MRVHLQVRWLFNIKNKDKSSFVMRNNDYQIFIIYKIKLQNNLFKYKL